MSQTPTCNYSRSPEYRRTSATASYFLARANIFSRGEVDVDADESRLKALGDVSSSSRFSFKAEASVHSSSSCPRSRTSSFFSATLFSTCTHWIASLSRLFSAASWALTTSSSHGSSSLSLAHRILTLHSGGYVAHEAGHCTLQFWRSCAYLPN